MGCSKEIILEKKEAIFSVKQQLLLNFLKVAFAIYFHHAAAVVLNGLILNFYAIIMVS